MKKYIYVEKLAIIWQELLYSNQAMKLNTKTYQIKIKIKSSTLMGFKKHNYRNNKIH